VHIPHVLTKETRRRLRPYYNVSAFTAPHVLRWFSQAPMYETAPHLKIQHGQLYACCRDAEEPQYKDWLRIRPWITEYGKLATRTTSSTAVPYLSPSEVLKGNTSDDTSSERVMSMHSEQCLECWPPHTKYAPSPWPSQSLYVVWPDSSHPHCVSIA
jgi:hypothetical protein